MDDLTDSLFGPPGTAWVPVQPALARMRRLVVMSGIGLVTLVLVGGGYVVTSSIWVLYLLLPIAAVATWAWWLIGRNVHNWGYAERDEDLWITRGAILRRLVVVPYGRMQLVDVTVGPIERAFGIAAVQLHTASPATDARIPGLAPAEAARLRDRLTELGEAEQAGL